MKTSEIQDLVKIVEASDIDELEISRWGRKIRITKNKNHQMENSAVPQVALPIQNTAATAPAGESPASAPTESESKSTEDNGSVGGEGLKREEMKEVKSPIVGTFYRASSPDSDPFAQVGDRVRAGQTLCIIEAMKIMNEIESETDGVVREILVQDADPVEYNQTLFLIEAS